MQVWSPDERFSLEVQPEAMSFIRERGGTLFVWCDSAGLLRSSTKQPSSSDRWTRIEVIDVTVCVHEDVGGGTAIYVVLMGFPWKRLEVTTGNVEWSGDLGAV